MCELLFILQRISVTNIILSNNVYDLVLSVCCCALLNLESFIHGHFLSFFFFFFFFFLVICSCFVVVVLVWFACSFKWNKEVLSLT